MEIRTDGRGPGMSEQRGGFRYTVNDRGSES